MNGDATPAAASPATLPAGSALHRAPGRVQGKVAIITGGAGGIGQAIARRLGEQGARVVLTDLSSGSREAALAGLQARGIEALYLEHDVRDEAGWKRVIEAARQRFGRLDILVNNAGVAQPPPPEGFEGLSLDDWRQVMSVNLDGVFLGMREAVLAMRDGGGSIVNIGSVAAYVGTPGGAAYGASKGGLRALTKQAAVGCARKGYAIRINCIHPCYIWTPLVQQSAQERFGKQGAEQAIRDLHPFKCLGEPDDVAYAVLYLASDEARLVNGTDLVVDGALLST